MRNFETKDDNYVNDENNISRIGERVIEYAIDGTLHRFAMNPNKYACRILATQLIDEWELRYRQAEPSQFGPQMHRQTLRNFLSFIDNDIGISSSDIRLDKDAEHFLYAFYKWEQHGATRLPSTSPEIKRQPIRVLSLIRQRASRGLAVCEEIVDRSKNSATFGTRSMEHAEEFSRNELKTFMRQARKSIRADQERLSRFRTAVAQDRLSSPTCSAFDQLLNKTAENTLLASDVVDHYESPHDMPHEVEYYASQLGIKMWESGSRTWLNSMNLFQRLIYATERELVPPLLMLIYKTGLTYGEIRSLRLSSIVDEGSSIALRCVKRRANTEVVHRFPVSPQARRSPWSVIGLLEYIKWLTKPARDEATAAQADLLLMVHYVSNGRRYVRHATHRKYRLSSWLRDHQLDYAGSATWNRLRKSHHTVRALNSTDPRSAGSNHSSKVFESHYLSTRTVLEKSGKSYIRSAQDAFREATKGPQVERSWAWNQELSFNDSRFRGALAEARDESPSDRSTTVGKCSDMENSPFAVAGRCMDQVRLCIVCPNALILKDHLPQVLLLQDHLEELRKLSDPVRFHEHYGYILASITAVLGRFDETDISRARLRVEGGFESLCIPTSMRVAF